MSPFDDANPTVPPPQGTKFSPPLDLTLDNVELVLDELRPMLQADGGDVKVISITDPQTGAPIVTLELVGACGTCPSSTQTMKMGLERKLLEYIPTIQAVKQSQPTGPPLTLDEVEVVLDTVRPFLKIAGGEIHIDLLEGETSVQPTVTLRMEGASRSLNSVKVEIGARIQRHFILPGLRVNWV
jgi:Fe-S cluster biogenesis protein NfuA